MDANQQARRCGPLCQIREIRPHSIKVQEKISLRHNMGRKLRGNMSVAKLKELRRKERAYDKTRKGSAKRKRSRIQYTKNRATRRVRRTGRKLRATMSVAEPKELHKKERTDDKKRKRSVKRKRSRTRCAKNRATRRARRALSDTNAKKRVQQIPISHTTSTITRKRHCFHCNDTQACERPAANAHTPQHTTKCHTSAKCAKRVDDELPKYVNGALYRVLHQEYARRRGYRAWGDVARMCADAAFFQEITNSDWNHRTHNTGSSAINTYRAVVLKLPRFRRDRVSASKNNVIHNFADDTLESLSLSIRHGCEQVSTTLVDAGRKFEFWLSD